jgi:hypothetical protein
MMHEFRLLVKCFQKGPLSILGKKRAFVQMWTSIYSKKQSKMDVLSRLFSNDAVAKFFRPMSQQLQFERNKGFVESNIKGFAAFFDENNAVWHAEFDFGCPFFLQFAAIES